MANEWLPYLRSKMNLILGLSGGYGHLQGAQSNTGASGTIRFDIGSDWIYSDGFQFGSEIGFQEGSQMVMSKANTQILGANALPVFLIMKSTPDFLLTARYHVYKSFFVEGKGGAAYQGTMINGADVSTKNKWLPDIQAGFGTQLTSHNRLAVKYQRFFGSNPILTNMDLNTGVSVLKGVPTWQAILLSVEFNV